MGTRAATPQLQTIQSLPPTLGAVHHSALRKQKHLRSQLPGHVFETQKATGYSFGSQHDLLLPRNISNANNRFNASALGSSIQPSQMLVEEPSSDMIAIELIDQPRPSNIDSNDIRKGGAHTFPYRRVEDAWAEFEARLEADFATVGSTLLAIVGVIVFWRGVWSLLDHYVGDNAVGDLSCILAGLAIILYIKLANLRVGSFWPDVD